MEADTLLSKIVALCPKLTPNDSKDLREKLHQLSADLVENHAYFTSHLDPVVESNVRTFASEEVMTMHHGQLILLCAEVAQQFVSPEIPEVIKEDEDDMIRDEKDE